MVMVQLIFNIDDVCLKLYTIFSKKPKCTLFAGSTVYMSADHELEVSLTPLIAANNSHCRLTGPPQCLAGYIVSGLYAQF